MKPDDIVHRKHNVNTYGTIISFISNFSTEVADTDEMYKMLNKFNNEINELKSDYSAGEDKEIDAVIENASLVFNNQLKFFDDFLLKYKQRTPTKQISKRGSSSSPLSIWFASLETIAERVKLKPRKRKKSGTKLKFLTPNKLWTTLPILLAQIQAGNNWHELKNEIRQILYLLYHIIKFTLI